MSAARLLARASAADPAERSRRRLTGAGVAVCTGVLLAVADVAAFTRAEVATCDTVGEAVVCRSQDGAVVDPFGGWDAGLSTLVTESGLRPGLVVAGLLLLVPFAVLTVQVMRLGGTARERRLAALAVAGATPADLRRVAAAETVPATLVGGLLGPLVLGVLLLLDHLLPSGFRLLPAPGPAVALAWPVVVAVLASGTAGFAGRGARAVRADPLGLSRHTPRGPGRPTAAMAGALLLVLGVLGVLLVVPDVRPLLIDVGLLAFPVVLAALALVSGPWLVLVAARVCERGGDPVGLLAARRLATDPRTPGRPAGVLAATGAATGIGGVLAALTFRERPEPFFVGSYALAGAAAILALTVAAAALAAGAGEQVLDG